MAINTIKENTWDANDIILFGITVATAILWGQNSTLQQSNDVNLTMPVI